MIYRQVHDPIAGHKFAWDPLGGTDGLEAIDSGGRGGGALKIRVRV